jgi:hypothetical protein
MTMTIKELQAIVRDPIVVGKSYTFYCEVQQEYEPPEKRLRKYTGQDVTVIRNRTREEYDGPGPDDNDDDFDTSRLFVVRASDGVEFDAHIEELNGLDRDLGQYFNPDATYGPDRDTLFLENEQESQ